jgi:hypothetical protein
VSELTTILEVKTPKINKKIIIPKNQLVFKASYETDIKMPDAKSKVAIEKSKCVPFSSLPGITLSKSAKQIKDDKEKHGKKEQVINKVPLPDPFNDIFKIEIEEDPDKFATIKFNKFKDCCSIITTSIK